MMTTREHFEKKAKEAGYDDFLHWCDCYDYETQPEKIVEWTDELLEALTVPYQCCPVCNGIGKVLADGFISNVYDTCKACHGAMVIPMHTLDKKKPGSPPWL